jgi:hypothetical protein
MPDDEPPSPAAWDIPTEATPVVPQRQEFPAIGVPVDPAIGGVTEVLGAHRIGLEAPEDEGIEVSALDSLFGEGSFVEYEDVLVPVLLPRASGNGGELVVVDRPRTVANSAPFSRLQKTLMGVAGGLGAVLLLIVLFLAGQRFAAGSPAPTVVAEPTPSAVPLAGPVAPGEYYWNQLLGGECVSPFTSAWADIFTVVPCAQPHAAQLVLKGSFAEAVVAEYPGVDELQKLAASLCAAPTVIDYATVAGVTDIQVLASFAADEQDWLGGNRTFFCFASRTGGGEFTTSIVPRPAP